MCGDGGGSVIRCLAGRASANPSYAAIVAAVIQQGHQLEAILLARKCRFGLLMHISNSLTKPLRDW
jgi:hypothetical protein